MEGRIQEVQSHIFTGVNQNHEKWFISQAHSSISDTYPYNFAASNATSLMSMGGRVVGFRRYNTKLLMCTKT